MFRHNIIITCICWAYLKYFPNICSWQLEINSNLCYTILFFLFLFYHSWYTLIYVMLVLGIQDSDFIFLYLTMHNVCYPTCSLWYFLSKVFPCYLSLFWPNVIIDTINLYFKKTEGKQWLSARMSGRKEAPFWALMASSRNLKRASLRRKCPK